MGLFGTKIKKSLEVEGMTCGHCVMRVTKALKGVDGVKSAKVDVEKKEAVVTCDEGVDDAALVKVVEDAGYKAKVKK